MEEEEGEVVNALLYYSLLVVILELNMRKRNALRSAFSVLVSLMYY